MSASGCHQRSRAYSVFSGTNPIFFVASLVADEPTSIGFTTPVAYMSEISSLQKREVGGSAVPMPASVLLVQMLSKFKGADVFKIQRYTHALGSELDRQ